jgi:NAD(P)-dependent dehydrogenase (short-subunit alcohol dehydrogenase family)
MKKLDGKIAIVTGASRGIGKAIAKDFAAWGAKVVCAARTVTEGDHFLEGSLESTVSEIRQAGGAALAVAADVSNEESCAHLVHTAKETFGPVDILVNDAVLSYFTPTKDISVNRWMRAFAVNVHGPFLLSQMVLPDMIERRSGAIVNISSEAAVGPGRGPYGEPALVGSTLYGATKAAVERFTQGLAEEVYPYGISVTCVSPSTGVVTPGGLHHGIFTGPDDPRAEPPEMMTQAVLLLVTEPLDKVTGRVTYCQEILKEFGRIPEAKGCGVDRPGSGFSRQ